MHTDRSGGTLAVTNVGRIATGSHAAPLDEGSDTVVVVDGRITQVGTGLDLDDVPVVLDANGLVLAPGLVDAHSHPVIAGYNPKQGLYDFVSYYLKAGVVGFVSMGAVHYPGFHGTDADHAVAIAQAAGLAYEATTAPGEPVVDGRCLLATPDMTTEHLDRADRLGVRRLKFLYAVPADRRRELARHAAALGWLTMVHCGGTSVGGSRPMGFDEIADFAPNVLAHLNGGPTSLERADIARLVAETDSVVDIVKCGNPRRALDIVGELAGAGRWDRLVLGTDSPTASGMVPSGLWYLIALLGSIGGLPPEQLVAAATGTSSGLYWGEPRVIAPGAPGSFVLLGSPAGGAGQDALASLALGDLPGLGALVVDGHLVATAGFNTPPPHRAVAVRQQARPLLDRKA
jgi:enamidase